MILQQVFCRWSVDGVDLQHAFQNGVQLFRLLVRNGSESSSLNFGRETLHILGVERRLKSAHFLTDNPHAPDVALRILRLVSPNFGRALLGSASLGLCQSNFLNFAYVQISNLGLLALV